jgi:hypothetical protein
MADLSDAEIAELQNNKSFVDRLMADPATRPLVLQAAKKMSPNTYIPEIDAAKPLVDRIAKLESVIVGMHNKNQSDKNQATIAGARDRLRSEGWTTEGIGAVEKLMVERNIPDYDAAAALYEKMHPQTADVVPSYAGERWTLPNDKNLMADPDGWGDTEMANALRDFRSGRVS